MTIDDRVDDEVSAEEASSANRQRVLVYSAAALAVLLVGAAIGMLVTFTTMGDQAPSSPGADSVDVGFAQDMSTHHLQAVSMASWTRDHTADPVIKTLAFDIESTQKTQVGMMNGYLDIWGQPESRPPDRQPMSWMATDSSGAHTHGGTTDHPEMQPGQLMPGMATQEELVKLRKMSGKELDVYFLQLMIRHHDGGLSMATYGQQHVQLDPLRNLSRTIVAAQTGEVSYMKQLLAERGGQPLPGS